MPVKKKFCPKLTQALDAFVDLDFASPATTLNKISIDMDAIVLKRSRAVPSWLLSIDAFFPINAFQAIKGGLSRTHD